MTGWDGMGLDISQTTTTTRAPLAVLITSRVTCIRYLQYKMTTELVAYQNLDNLKYHFSLFTTNIENSSILSTDVQVEIVVLDRSYLTQGT